MAIIFSWSAGGKLLWPTEFAQLIRGLGIVPDEWVIALAFSIPVAELAIAITLFIPRAAIIAASAATFLSLVFSGIHLYILVMGKPVPCGCAGIAMTTEGHSTHVIMLLLSAAMAAASAYLLVADGSSPRRSSLEVGPHIDGSNDVPSERLDLVE